MRFGWLMAALAALAAVPAQAAQFVQFTLSGHGAVTSYNSNRDPYAITKESDVYITFAVDIQSNQIGEPGWYISDGSSFFAPLGGNFWTASISDGYLQVEDNSNFGLYILVNNSRLSVHLDPSIQTFADIKSGPATGVATISYQSHYFGQDFVGTISSIMVTPTSDYYGLFATAVPEPATWAMVIFGFGAIGATMRRRQPNAALSAATAV